ncbi:MAG: aldehyde ferredoxin oxidoreductase family protein [Candidatus Binatia bacterium]
MYGFHGHLLHVDLTSAKFTWHNLDEARLQACLGGIGLGTSLLYEYAPARADPLGPENPLIFASAPLVGTSLTTTAKYAVVTKSPLTGFIADSLSSSYFALELKKSGVDALVITGQSPSWVYLAFDHGKIILREATQLLGKSARDTESCLRAESGNDDLRVAAIGMAGENGVRFATISNDGRHAGRGGVGAVMGAKRLKAIAIRGAVDTAVADPGGVAALALAMRHKSIGTLTAKYRQIGTVANLAVFNRLGSLPTRNFQRSTFAHAEALSGEHLTENNFSRRNGCAACTIRCERLFKSLAGAEQRLEYETLFALGPMCEIDEPGILLEAARLCDDYGLDSISTGATIAWAMECAEKGLLPQADLFGLRFGRAEAFLKIIPLIARRSGLGELLAEGSKRASGLIGKDAGDWAMHVKGLELPGYEPRSLKTMALGLAVSPRGACHNRSGAYEFDFSGEVDRLHGDAGRGSMVAASEDFAAVLDSLIVCKFLRKCFTDFYAEAAELLGRVTGWPCSSAELRQAGERINVQKKLFNIREGWQPEDDWLPPRLLHEKLADGVAQGVELPAAELREMIQSYYLARGWDNRGFVPDDKLRQLKIS